MIAAFDVCYPADGGAWAAAVLFRGYRDATPAAEYTRFLPRVAGYIPGEFYRRELPCILALLEQIRPGPEEVIVDGYVMLGERPGLGHRLFEAMGGWIPVVGVAKSRFQGSNSKGSGFERSGFERFGAVEVFRGGSRRPLHVTSAGTDVRRAAENIRIMHGPYRIPTLLKRVDALAREKARDRSSARAG
jgi:deoxyribonuclease V